MRTLVLIRNYLLLAASIAVLFAIPVSEQLQFDQRIESFFAHDNPDLQILERSRKEFGGDEFVVIAWTEPRLFAIDAEHYPDSLEGVLALNQLPEVNPEAAIRIRQVAAQLNGIPGVNVEQTQHLADFLDSAPKFKPSRRAMLRLFEGTLVGQDGRTNGIMLQLLPEEESGISRGETLRQIRDVAAAMIINTNVAAGASDVAVAGEPVQVFDMFEMVEQDGQLLFLVSLAILSLVLLLMFRSLRWILAPVGIVLGSVIMTRTILVLVGAELSMVSSMLNSLVTVIGIATCMHVIVHYRDLRNALVTVSDGTANSVPTIANQTLKDMAGPVFWTCVTTAVGFASLLVSQITPLRSFAVMMCLSTGVVLLGCLFILPATLASGSRLRVPATVPLEHWLDKALHVNCRALESQPIGAGLVCLLLFVVAVPGILRLDVETDFSKNFKESSTIVQSLQFVESRLGGAGSWEVSFDTPQELTNDFLKDVDQLTDELTLANLKADFDSRRFQLSEELNHYSISDATRVEFREVMEASWPEAWNPDEHTNNVEQFVRELRIHNVPENLLDSIRQLAIAPRSVVGEDNQVRVLSLSSLAGLPPRILGPAKTLQRISRTQPVLIDNFYNKDARRMRILFRSLEQQSAEDKARQIQCIRDCVRDFFEEHPEHVQSSIPEASGMFVLLAELIRSLLSDQLLSFTVACGGILTCMTIAFRSLRIGFVSLFPNIFPVAVVMGALGWAGEPVNIGTAMITSVSMGLTVDSTIHYITAFERARKSRSVMQALQVAHAGAGRAVVLSHLALVAGFLVLTASRFIPLVYFGALLSLSMIGGIFGDLVLLPLLLRLVTPESVATSETSAIPADITTDISSSPA